MRTVKDFKDAGLVFVAFGDTCQVVGAIVPFMVNDTWVSNANNSTFCDTQEVKSFAWRQLNTLPYNPKFAYEIDITNHRWRPMLEQVTKPSDTKPVFTQEMADKKRPSTSRHSHTKAKGC